MEQPSIVKRGPFTVVGLKRRGTSENVTDEVPPMWGRLMQRQSEISGRVNQREAYGIIGNCDEDTKEYDYVAGFEVAGDPQVPDGMVSWVVPGQTYAVFPTTLPTLMETFNYICGVWLPQSEWERDTGPEFEFYGEDFDPHTDDFRMEIYVPVVRASVTRQASN